MESSSEKSQTESEYEFTQQQNGIIDKLAYEIHWVSVGFTVLGLLYALNTASILPEAFESYYTLFPLILLGLISLFLILNGIWARNASKAFKQVVMSQGQDIQHLMNALDNLRKKYGLLSLIVKMYAIGIAIGLVAAMVYLFMGISK